MTSIEQVNADVIREIMKAFPQIPFTAPEELEKIARPSFKVILDEIKSERYAGYARRTYPVTLVYFAENTLRPKAECLAVYEQLEPALYGMTHKIEADIDSQDAVLVVGFEVMDTVPFAAPDGSTGEDIENLELMEELN